MRVFPASRKSGNFSLQLWYQTCFGCTCKQTHCEGQVVQSTRPGSHIELRIVTLSTAASPENSPLRWAPFSFMLFVWNSLVCCVWAFFCRMTQSAATKGKPSVSWPRYSEMHSSTNFLYIDIIGQTNKLYMFKWWKAFLFYVPSKKHDFTAKRALLGAEQ